MLKIDSDLKITMFKGDTGTLSVAFNKNTLPYAFLEGDKVYFTMKKLMTQPLPTLSKEVTTFNGNVATITIDPEDTINLEAGAYFYDIQINYADGTVDTLVPKVSKFVLNSGVKND